MKNVVFPCFMGTFHRRNGFHTVQTVFSFTPHHTNPTPKPTPHRKLSAFLDFQKTSFCMIYKLVTSWGPKKWGPHNVINTRYTHTHTHTRTPTNSWRQWTSTNACSEREVACARVIWPAALWLASATHQTWPRLFSAEEARVWHYCTVQWKRQQRFAKRWCD